MSLDEDHASRVTTIKIGTGTPVLVAEYRYLGAGTLVETKLAQPNVYSRLHDNGGTPTYSGFNQWGWTKQTRWTKGLATPRNVVSLAFSGVHTR